MSRRRELPASTTRTHTSCTSNSPRKMFVPSPSAPGGSLFANLSDNVEQEDPPQDRLGDSRHSRLGVLSAGKFIPTANTPPLTVTDSFFSPDSRQVCPRIWLDLRSAERHWSQRQPILPRRLDRSNCAARVAAPLLHSHRQSPPPNIDAGDGSGMGHCTDLHGRMPQLPRPSCDPLLSRPVRGRLSAALQYHYEPMVSSS
jgi:hypothetical protein